MHDACGIRMCSVLVEHLLCWLLAFPQGGHGVIVEGKPLVLRPRGALSRMGTKCSKRHDV